MITPPGVLRLYFDSVENVFSFINLNKIEQYDYRSPLNKFNDSKYHLLIIPND
jgi:hypothetical protein